MMSRSVFPRVEVKPCYEQLRFMLRYGEEAMSYRMILKRWLLQFLRIVLRLEAFIEAAMRQSKLLLGFCSRLLYQQSQCHMECNEDGAVLVFVNDINNHCDSEYIVSQVGLSQSRIYETICRSYLLSRGYHIAC